MSMNQDDKLLYIVGFMSLPAFLHHGSNSMSFILIVDFELRYKAFRTQARSTSYPKTLWDRVFYGNGQLIVHGYWYDTQMRYMLASLDKESGAITWMNEHFESDLISRKTGVGDLVVS